MPVSTLRVAVVALVACTDVAVRGNTHEYTIDFPEEGEYPRVVLTADEVRVVRVRSWEPWALSIREEILARADALVEEELDIPHKEGQWIHWYACTRDATPLHALDARRHMCPHCGTVYSGYPFDDVYVALRHDHWLEGVATLGLAYTLRPEGRYAERARDILVEYASFYTVLRLHNKYDQLSSSKARLYAQTLDEAVALCHIVFGYDLVHDAPAFSRQDRHQINRQLIRPMVKTIRANDGGISNWQSWHNAAVAMAGCLLRDRSMVTWALHGKSGFLHQMRRSLMGTGMWYEESPIYHFYALRAHVYLLEAVARAGVPIYEHPRVRSMFEAPLRIVLPDGTLPPLNDSDRLHMQDYAHFYDIAYRRYGTSAFRRWAEPRESAWALLWGAETLPAVPPAPARASTNSASEGLAVLRSADEDTVAMLEYGPGLSGHVHPAKLNLLLYSLGDILLVDPGRISYGSPLQNEWYKQTLAHNSVVVNEGSQARTRGRLKSFSTEPPVIRAWSDSAYPGATIDRTLMLHENVLIDLVTCAADRASTFDLPLHVDGDLQGLSDGDAMESLGRSAGYQHLNRIIRHGNDVRTVDVVPANSSGRLRLHLPGNALIFSATGPGNPPGTQIPLLLQRQQGTMAAFAVAYEILKPGESPREVSVTLERQGDAWSAAFDTIRVTAGAETVVEVAGRRYVIGRHGIIP